MTEFESIRYEKPLADVARVVLARADTRNAQDKKMLYEINRAFDLMHEGEVIRSVVDLGG